MHPKHEDTRGLENGSCLHSNKLSCGSRQSTRISDEETPAQWVPIWVQNPKKTIGGQQDGAASRSPSDHPNAVENVSKPTSEEI